MFSLFKQWALEEEVNADINELAGPIYDFLLPMGLESFAEKFSGCECENVHGDCLRLAMTCSHSPK